MELDDAQRAAAEAGPGALCIVAPPGSGKTHTLVERIAYLVSKQNASPERILALTFTNKAAREMRDRLDGRFPAAPHCTTFHALAHLIVREHGALLGIPADFTLVEDEKEKTAGSLTFDELLSAALTILEAHEVPRAVWQRRFDHLLVDEYQDTDDRQDTLVALLAELHGNVSVIGDPHQAIYGFRGANAARFAAFAERYPGARHTLLGTNYRSTPTIIAAAQSLMGGEPPAAHRADLDEKITLAAFPDPHMEARWIVNRIERLVGGLYHESGAHEAPYQPGDVAVLYRFNAIGKQIEQAFAEAGIPYVLVNESNIDEVEFDTFRVPLMTMHAAKGLEFPVVFAAGLEDGVAPYLAEDTDLAEEKRLFYVAMTRAKDRLFLSHSARRRLFGKTFGDPSRFIGELPAAHLMREERQRPKPRQKKLF